MGIMNDEEESKRHIKNESSFETKTLDLKQALDAKKYSSHSSRKPVYIARNGQGSCHGV